MSVTQTVEIPANPPTDGTRNIERVDEQTPHGVGPLNAVVTVNATGRRLTIDVPREVPAGPVVLTFTPATVREKTAVPEDARGQSNSDDFRRALRRAYGAWAANPWENCIEDIRAMRGEWSHRDPWNPDPAKRHHD